jgi:hypothetical protein
MGHLLDGKKQANLSDSVGFNGLIYLTTFICSSSVRHANPNGTLELAGREAGLIWVCLEIVHTNREKTMTI